MADPGTIAPAAETGWDELERGEWAAAPACFDERLRAQPDDARALEGRAWAAWWVDDAATLFRVREAAYLAYREQGDAVGAARLAIWLGCDHHEIKGEHAVANGWYGRARRLLGGHAPTPEHAWLAFQEGAYAIELDDDTVTAKAKAAEAIELARALDLFDVVVLGLALEGLALVTEGAVAEGMRRLDEASVAATSGELRERIATTWTLCYLIYACERVRDFARTTQWCTRMREVADRVGFDAGVGICRVHYGVVLVLHGQWSHAEDELRRSREVFARVRPAAVPESDARLGELRRRQGRAAEAEELLTRALPHPLAVLGLASLHLDRGDAEGAVAHLEDLVAATPAESVTQVADAHALLARAYSQLGRTEDAVAASRALACIAEAVPDTPLAAMAEEARGAVALASGDHTAARRSFSAAVRAYERGGLPFEAAHARRRLAVALTALGQDDAARVEEQRASDELAALGAAAPVRRGQEHATAGHAGAEAGLTRRETEVLGLLAEGLRDRDIAERLTISHHTVHRHVSSILTKLGLSSRAAAAAYAARNGHR